MNLDIAASITSDWFENHNPPEKTIWRTGSWAEFKQFRREQRRQLKRVGWTNPLPRYYFTPSAREFLKTSNRIAITLSLIAILGIAAGSLPRKHEVVLLRGNVSGHSTSTGYEYGGIDVYVSSSSSGAPTFPQMNVQVPVPLTPMAEAIAQLMDAGYEIVISPDGLIATATK